MANDAEASISEVVAAVPAIPTSAQPGVIKAISYLLGGVGNYMGAWLRRPAQGVEDGTSARTIVSTALAQAAASRAAADKDLVEAALNQWAPAALNRQANKARIARKTLEELSGSEKPFNGEEIADDFLNTFEKFCEDTSSDKMQRLWARVLAGELRQPGSFSRRTLRSLYDLDPSTAELFDQAARDVIEGIIVLSDGKQNDQLKINLELEAAGLLTGAGGILSFNVNFNAGGVAFINGESAALVLAGTPKSTITLKALPLSAVGRELLMLLADRDERRKLREVAEEIRDKGATGVSLAVMETVDNELKYRLLEHLWGQNPFDLTN